MHFFQSNSTQLNKLVGQEKIELLDFANFFTENTKLMNGMDTLNVDIKKIESDYFNPRINNLDKVYQEIPTEQEDVREYTQEKDTLDNVKLADRLDPGMLDPFKQNPYTQSLSSFSY